MRLRAGGWTGHADLGLVKHVEVSPALTLSPLVRIDYAGVGANAYTEAGAGALSLAVGSQTHQELRLSAGLNAAYRIADHLTLKANLGAGYNALDNRTHITAAFAGGGPGFVTYGADLSPWLFMGGISLAGMRAGLFDVAVSYEVEASPSGFVNQVGALRITMQF